MSGRSEANEANCGAQPMQSHQPRSKLLRQGHAVVRCPQRGETTGDSVPTAPPPSVWCPALRIEGCASGPRIETFGGSAALTVEALAEVRWLVTDKFQSSVFRGRSTSPDPDTTPCGVCILNILHQKFPTQNPQT